MNESEQVEKMLRDRGVEPDSINTDKIHQINNLLLALWRTRQGLPLAINPDIGK